MARLAPGTGVFFGLFGADLPENKNDRTETPHARSGPGGRSTVADGDKANLHRQSWPNQLVGTWVRRWPSASRGVQPSPLPCEGSVPAYNNPRRKIYCFCGLTVAVFALDRQ